MTRALIIITLILIASPPSLAAGTLVGFLGPTVPIIDRMASPSSSRGLVSLVDSLNAAMPAGSGVSFVYQQDGAPCDTEPYRYGVNNTPLGSVTVCAQKGLLDGAAGRTATQTDPATGTFIERARVTISLRGIGRSALCHELMHAVTTAIHEDADPTLGGCLASTANTFGPDDVRLLEMAYS